MRRLEEEYTTKTTDDPLNGLLAHGEVSGQLYLNPKALRPCVANMIKTGFEKGGSPDRSSVSSVIASEFVKLGFERERIEHELIEWNKLNDPPLNNAAIISTIKTAIRKNYNYTCRHAFLADICIGRDFCSYSKSLANDRHINFRLFFIYNWQLILNNIAVLVYWVALPELEKRKGLKPGSVIYENHCEIAKYAGISKKYVRNALESLKSFGLIDYKPGTPRKWEGKATEIMRKFPIPKPPRAERLRVTKDLP